ncbi:Gfo/Idh/MocA family protein [Haloferula sp.]|uniref:Gfo/Idh/MocA family protein n=1 Tax=Haloferula sp. TaxID=2497595 RepID=UPI00329D6E29
MSSIGEHRPVKVGIAGCGYWGPNLARNFDALACSELVAVCDPNADRLEHMRHRYPSLQCFESVEKMLATAEIDAVAVATPVKTHHQIAQAAMSAGKHVLIEKPMAASSEECEEMIATAEETKLTLMAGHTFLYSEPVRKIVEIIQSGEIGEIRYINCQRLNLGLFHQDINVAWDLAPHDLSIILHVLGESPQIVNCQGQSFMCPGVEDVTNMSLSFKGQRFATIQSSWMEPRKVRQITFVGTRKMIVYDDLEPLEKLRIHDVRVDAPPHYDSFDEFHYSYHYGDCHIPRLEQIEPLKQMCSHFIDCVVTGKEPLTNGRKGLELVRILEAASESLECAGGPVPFSQTDSKPEAFQAPIAGKRVTSLKA